MGLTLFAEYVVPHAGTWIEIVEEYIKAKAEVVVPHAGTWIEITKDREKIEKELSFPTRKRGLK